MRFECLRRVIATLAGASGTRGVVLVALLGLVQGCAPSASQPRATRRPLPNYFQPHAVATEPIAAVEVGDTCGSGDHQLFPPAAPWNQVVNARPTAPDSQAVIRYLEAEHSTKYRFQVDFSLVVLEATRNVRAAAFTPTENHYSPDCDLAPIPLLPGGKLEGEQGYACLHGDDCHLLVLARHECRLYEMWKADIRGDQFQGGCLAVWDLKSVYPESGRGEYCTSADAAGLPIAPLVFTADDIARGQIAHAVRFVLPNANVRSRVYVAPATHSTPSTVGPVQAPAYGALLRLRADFDHARLKPGARVVTRALQSYGMYLADAGFLTFTASDDTFSQKKWSEVGFGAEDLRELSWSDFEVVDSGPYKPWEGTCVREPIVR